MEQWRPLVRAGVVVCPYCGKAIAPTDEWDLGHTDDRTGYIGATHAVCNRREAAYKTARLRAGNSRVVSREW